MKPQPRAGNLVSGWCRFPHSELTRRQVSWGGAANRRRTSERSDDTVSLTGPMIELLLRLIAWLMSRIRVNRVERCDRDGVPVIIKRRRCCGSVVILVGNRFLALAQSGVQMFVRTRAWMAWEQHCVGLLYTDRPKVLADTGSSVRVPAMPGTSLRRLLEQGNSCLNAFVAAARELRRAHRMQCCFFSAGWSHGDLHLDNILYDGETDRAFLIDFDTRHKLGIDENRRHADDLKVLLLELVIQRSHPRTFKRFFSGVSRIRFVAPPGFNYHGPHPPEIKIQYPLLPSFKRFHQGPVN